MGFKHILYSILDNINKYENKNVMLESINSRLNNSLENYYDELVLKCKYILSKNTLSLLSAINKQFNEKGGTDNND